MRLVHIKPFNLEMVDGDPGVRGVLLDHWNKELNAPIPVRQKQHQHNQFQDTHHSSC